MKTVTAMLVLVVLSAFVFGLRLSSQPASYVIGGEYILHTGEVIQGDLRALFAQITVENGARVDGRITAISSTVDIAGSVGGSVLLVGSDIAVQATAMLAESPQRVETIPYVILLPRMTRTGNAAHAPR